MPPMLRHVARQSADLVRQLAQLFPERLVFAATESRQVIHFVVQLVRAAIGELGDQFDFTERQIERLADFAHRRAQPVRRERAYQTGMLGAIARVDAADQLFANLAREIEIDVRHGRERLVQKAAEEQLVGDGIDVGQAEEIADDRRD